MRTHINDQYRALLYDIGRQGFVETNRRTGVDIAMADGPRSISLDLSAGDLPVVGNRRMFAHIAAAETAWEMMGTQSPDFVMRRAPKLWSKFVQDGKIKAAYGYRWREHFGRDQLDLATAALMEDPSNRQVYVSTWDPVRDGLGEPDQPKNLPCIVGFGLTRVGDRLNMGMTLRSSDVFVGLPYDIMGYAMKLSILASTVHARPGTLHITMIHPHIYEPHFKMARQSLDPLHKWQGIMPSLPRGWGLKAVATDPDGYVAEVRRHAGMVAQHDWNPMPEVVA